MFKFYFPDMFFTTFTTTLSSNLLSQIIMLLLKSVWRVVGPWTLWSCTWWHSFVRPVWRKVEWTRPWTLWSGPSEVEEANGEVGRRSDLGHWGLVPGDNKVRPVCRRAGRTRPWTLRSRCRKNSCIGWQVMCPQYLLWFKCTLYLVSSNVSFLWRYLLSKMLIMLTSCMFGTIPTNEVDVWA